MPDLIFCAHCGLTIYAKEQFCPHCNVPEPKMGTKASKAIALSFLMGLGTACQPKIDLENTTAQASPMFAPEPHYDIQPEYGVIDVPIDPIIMQLNITEITVPSKHNENTAQIQSELQTFLQNCSSDIFPRGKTATLNLVIKDGTIKKPKLRKLDLLPHQRKCLKNALSEQTLSLPISGKIQFTFQATY